MIENEKGYVTVKSKNGAIEITCAKKQDVCVFAIDGYYHGKTMGLLGTNNNEKHDDFSAPKGNVRYKNSILNAKSTVLKRVGKLNCR